MIFKICPICGKEFQTYPSINSETCGSVCGGLLRKQRGLSEKQKKFYSDMKERNKKELICPVCGKIFTVQANDPQKFCSTFCSHIGQKHTTVQLVNRVCAICGKEFSVKPWNKKKTCSKSCQYTLMGLSSVGRKCSEKKRQQMMENNPSKNPCVLQKMKDTKIKNGTLHIWSGKRGGNGQFTKEQMILYRQLGEGWFLELPIKTHRKSPYPTNYKVDIGNPFLKIAIEVDGQTHNSPKQRALDLKKTSLLEVLGWRVLRFTNRQINQNLSDVILQIKNYLME